MYPLLGLATDHERARVLRLVCTSLGLSFKDTTGDDLLNVLAVVKEKADRYDDLCR